MDAIQHLETAIGTGQQAASSDVAGESRVHTANQNSADIAVAELVELQTEAEEE